MKLALEDGNVEQLVDPELGNDYEKNEMFRMIEAAAACVCYTASKRPKMSQVSQVIDLKTQSQLLPPWTLHGQVSGNNSVSLTFQSLLFFRVEFVFYPFVC
jgi:hypothetical protein